MSAVSLRIPDSIHRRIREMAQLEGVSINQLITSALVEKLSSLRADEADRRIRILRTQLLRDGDPGEHMAPGPTSRDQEAHTTRTRTRLRRASSRLSSTVAARFSGRRPTLSSNPTRNIVTTSELPP